MITASVYQMLKGALVFIAAIYSMILFKRVFYRHHWTAMIIVTAGVVVVGASPILYPDPNEKSSSESSAIFGIVLEVVGLLFIGGNWISEEKIFSVFYLNPISVVGWEGFWGACTYAILLVIFQFVP